MVARRQADAKRIQLLNGIGFQRQVGPEQNTFEFRRDQLATFQGQQGHCNVPQKLAEQQPPTLQQHQPQHPPPAFKIAQAYWGIIGVHRDFKNN